MHFRTLTLLSSAHPFPKSHRFAERGYDSCVHDPHVTTDVLPRYGSMRRARSALHCEPFVASATISHLCSHPHRILLTNSRKSPPSTHSPAAKVAPALAPQPSPTSPTIRAGWPPTTELGGTTILAGTTECGKILTFSLIMQKGCRTQRSPM